MTKAAAYELLDIPGPSTSVGRVERSGTFTTAYVPDVFVAQVKRGLKRLRRDGLVQDAWVADGVEFMIGADDWMQATPRVADVIDALARNFPNHPVDYHVVPPDALPPGPPYERLFREDDHWAESTR